MWVELPDLRRLHLISHYGLVQEHVQFERSSKTLTNRTFSDATVFFDWRQFDFQKTGRFSSFFGKQNFFGFANYVVFCNEPLQSGGPNASSSVGRRVVPVFLFL
jgi:hypothetical protein